MPIALFLVVGMMVSCEMSVFYDEHKTIKDNVWNIDDKMVFNPKSKIADYIVATDGSGFNMDEVLKPGELKLEDLCKELGLMDDEN